MAKPEELSLEVMLEMSELRAAGLLCAGLRVATGMKALSAGKVLSGIFSPGKPAIRKATITVIHFCHRRATARHSA